MTLQIGERGQRRRVTPATSAAASRRAAGRGRRAVEYSSTSTAAPLVLDELVRLDEVRTRDGAKHVVLAAEPARPLRRVPRAARRFAIFSAASRPSVPSACQTSAVPPRPSGATTRHVPSDSPFGQSTTGADRARVRLRRQRLRPHRQLPSWRLRPPPVSLRSSARRRRAAPRPASLRSPTGRRRRTASAACSRCVERRHVGGGQLGHGRQLHGRLGRRLGVDRNVLGHESRLADEHLAQQLAPLVVLRIGRAGQAMLRALDLDDHRLDAVVETRARAPRASRVWSRFSCLRTWLARIMSTPTYINASRSMRSEKLPLSEFWP